MKWLLKKIASLVIPFSGAGWVLRIIGVGKIILNLFIVEKGALSKKDERWLARFLDSVIKLKGIWELLDGPGLRTMIAIGDNYAVEKYVKEGGKNFLKEVIALAKVKDKEGIAKLIAEKANVDNAVIKTMGAQAIDFILTAVYEFVETVNVDDEDVE